VIPVFNELPTLPRVLLAVAAALPDVPKEIIVVDDCSTDGTREWLRAHLPADIAPSCVIAETADGIELRAAATGDAPAANIEPAVAIRVIYHPVNRGKGGALKSGFAAATGGVMVVQDADLEYDPRDWERMYDLVARRRVADVVYGCRFYGLPHRSLYFHHFLANRLISLIFNLLYNQMLMDVEVCYKMFRREVLDGVELRCAGFGIEIELSAKIAKARRWRIYEVGVSYFGRTYAEGKKINWRDGLQALWYLIRFRVSD
jgi:glycosyltransferase involved in cell wall biosynthesis